MSLVEQITQRALLARVKLIFSYSFCNAMDDSNEISALTSIGTMPNDVISDGLEEFLSKVYLPSIKTANVEKLRWWLFIKKQAPSRAVGTS